METMNFVCARCRYRVTFGFAPWEDCETCGRPRWQAPRVVERLDLDARTGGRKLAWCRPRVYWPMRDRDFEYKHLNVDEAKRMDHYGDDPQLGFECFNDFTHSPELRIKLREQVDLEIYLMPEIDLVDVFGPRHKKWNT
jgi:hypothetical protein